MKRMQDSPYWHNLWKHYKKAPSIAFCRVPELEYAATLRVDSLVLDHCCGDGLFASMIWGDKTIYAGCDIQPSSIAAAQKRDVYKRVDVCDVSTKLPYDSNYFDLVFNNSALEHISDLDRTLAEIARVLKPGGEFAFNVLNHRYFEWWPLDHGSKKAYREWQPFIHALSLAEWSDILARAGFLVTAVEGYFDQYASRRLAELDYLFSGAYIRGLSFGYVRIYRLLEYVMSSMLKSELASYTWKTEPDAGAGYFIRAVRRH